MFKVGIRARNAEKYLAPCIGSLLKQTCQDWQAALILDAPEDNTLDVAIELKKQLGDQLITKFNPTRRGLGYNIYHVFNMFPDVKPADVYVCLDGDDMLFPYALRKLQRYYRKNKNLLATYGSYIKASKGAKTKVSRPYPADCKAIRKYRWRGSHLKTFRHKLWTHFKPEYLKNDKGEWCDGSSDRGLMLAILEMAGLDRVKHIKAPLYYWRDNSKYPTKSKIQYKWAQYFKGMKPVARVDKV